MYFEGLHTFIVTKFDFYFVPNLEVILIHYFGIQTLSFIYVYHLCMGKIFNPKNKNCLICPEHGGLMIKTCSFFHPSCEFKPFAGRNYCMIIFGHFYIGFCFRSICKSCTQVYQWITCPKKLVWVYLDMWSTPQL